MRVELIQVDKPEKVCVYPCLKQYTGVTAASRVVLFNGPKTGVVVYTKGFQDENVGDYDNRWSENVYTPFEGTIRLSN